MPDHLRAIGLFGLGLALVSALSWVVAPIHVSSAELGGDLAEHYDEHRTLLLAFGFAAAVGNALQAVFAVALRSIVRGGRFEQALARVGMLCLLIEVAIVIVGFTIFSALAYAQPPNDVAGPLTDLAWLLVNQAAGPVTAIGLISLTVALARSGLVGSWVTPYTVVVGMAHLVVAATVAEQGFFSPAGEVAFAVPLLFFSWFAIVGYELTRRSNAGRAARRNPA